MHQLTCFSLSCSFKKNCSVISNRGITFLSFKQYSASIWYHWTKNYGRARWCEAGQLMHSYNAQSSAMLCLHIFSFGDIAEQENVNSVSWRQCSISSALTWFSLTKLFRLKKKYVNVCHSGQAKLPRLLESQVRICFRIFFTPHVSA